MEAIKENIEKSNSFCSCGEGERWELQWQIQLSVMYHLKRERFLDGCDRWSKFVSVVGGAASFSVLKDSPAIPALITIVSALSLVFGFSTKARKHADLARSFKNLEAELILLDCNCETKFLRNVKAQYLRIESEEPASLGALVTDCHNHLCTSHNRKEEITRLNWFHWMFKNWIDFDQSKIYIHRSKDPKPDLL